MANILSNELKTLRGSNYVLWIKILTCSSKWYMFKKSYLDIPIPHKPQNVEKYKIGTIFFQIQSLKISSEGPIF